MKTRSKGFTLIELLAVIVILAIIALIATPTILGVIERARKGAAESSALGYIDAVEKQIAINTLDSTKTDIADGVYTVAQLTAVGVNVKGQKPRDDSIVKVEKNQVVDYSLKIGDYVVDYDATKKKAVADKKENPKTELSGSTPTPSETTYKVFSNGEVVYYNPTAGEKCTNGEAGCMKFYTFLDEGASSDKINMILDHNTTSNIAYNVSNDNSAPDDTFKQKLSDDTKDWKTYTGTVPRLITADEIAKITGADREDTIKWSSTKLYGKDDIETQSAWFYFDGAKSESKTTYSSTDGWQKRIPAAKGESEYAWLFDNTAVCESYGCNFNDSVNTNNYGYWTSTPVGTAGSGSNVWRVYGNGGLGYHYADYPNIGLRPVITVSKSTVS